MRGQTIHLRYTNIQEFNKIASSINSPLSQPKTEAPSYSVITEKFFIPTEDEFSRIFLPQADELEFFLLKSKGALEKARDNMDWKKLREDFYRESFRQARDSEILVVGYKGIRMKTSGGRFRVRDDFTFKYKQGLSLVRFMIRAENYKRYKFIPHLPQHALNSSRLLGICTEGNS